MPPQITFITVKNQAIPLKIFVQGYSNTSSSSSDKKSLAINSKSLITLKNKFQVRLSQAYIETKIIPVIHDKLVELVSKRELNQQDTNQSGQITLEEKGVRLVVPIKVLISIRHRLGIEWQLNTDHDTYRGDMRMLVKQSVFTIPREEEEGLQEVSDVSEDKKRQKYKVKPKMIVGDLSDCIRVYMSI
ncbi:hypothetical protein JA1_000426 [Spathaspora sp. JA1]|nr:hypothetical protein JA1_000426 [Spathaspora sp. JA1]